MCFYDIEIIVSMYFSHILGVSCDIPQHVSSQVHKDTFLKHTEGMLLCIHIVKN